MHANEYNSKITIQTERVDNSKQHMTEWSFVKKKHVIYLYVVIQHIYTPVCIIKEQENTRQRVISHFRDKTDHTVRSLQFYCIPK